MNENLKRVRAGLLYFGFSLLILFLALMGYGGYVLYPRFDMPAVTGGGLVLLAAGAGIASFFSPCSFPLLLTLLSREIPGSDLRAGEKLKNLVKFAGAFSLGAATFLSLTGAGIAVGGGQMFKQVTFTSAAGIGIRLAVGVLLVLLGLVQLNVIPISFHRVEDLARPLRKAQSKLQEDRPSLAFAVFGFGYILAGFG